jgi:hypothetical protein
MLAEKKGFFVPGTVSSRRVPGGGWGKKRTGIFAKLLLRTGETEAKVRTGDDSDDIIRALEVNC